MILFPKDLLSKFLLLLCALVIGMSIDYIIKQDRWSPIDEYAHFDYIEKVIDGDLPAISDPISDELFYSIVADSSRSANGKVVSRDQLGIANYSYEGIHPPLYYCLLALPNILLKELDIPVFGRLQVLRIFSYLFFVVGMFLCIPLFKVIAFKYPIPPFYAYGCILFGLLIIPNQRYGLSNNMLSPLVINLTALFLFKYLRHPIRRNFLMFNLFSCFSVYVAISNLFLLPFLYIPLFYKFYSNFSIRTFLYSLLIFAAGIALFVYWKMTTLPVPLFDYHFQNILAAFIPAGLVDYPTFLTFWLDNLFQLPIVNDNFNIKWIIIGFVFFNLFLSIVFIRSIINKFKWVFYFAFMFVGLFLITFILNKYVPKVHWAAFRHYLGFMPVIYVSFSFWIVLVYNRFFKQPD